MGVFQNQIQVKDYLGIWDWAIFWLCLLATGGAVVWGNFLKRKLVHTPAQGLLDYLVLGRRLTLPLFVATLVATWYGGIFGVTQISFESGIYNFVTQGVFWYATYFIFAFWIVPKIAHTKALTVPELVLEKFGPRAARLSAVFNFINVIPIAYAISLGLFIQILFGISFGASVLSGVTLMACFTLFGGMRAVVFSDLVQFIVMCASVALVAIYSILQFGGWGFLHAQLPSTHFQITGDQGWGLTLVWGMIALSTLIDPAFYQRCFAATSPRVARNGILWSTFIWFCFDLCTTLGGMYARAVLPQADSKLAYLHYSIQLLPEGLRGFFLAGVLATVLSTLDADVLIAGTTLSYDLAPKRWRGKNFVHALGVLFSGGLAVVLAMGFSGNIKQVWKTMGSYYAACLLFPVLYGYFTPTERATPVRDRQFVVGSVFGILATTAWTWMPHTGFWKEIDAIYMGTLATALGLWLASPRVFGKIYRT